MDENLKQLRDELEQVRRSIEFWSQPGACIQSRSTADGVLRDHTENHIAELRRNEAEYMEMIAEAESLRI